RLVPDRIRIVAPADGIVVSRTVYPGQKFERGAEFYSIADLGRVWILADTFGDQARYLRPGATARVSLPDLGTSVAARVSEVGPQFDGATGSFKVRLEAGNAGYALRPEMFVDVEVTVALPPSIAVPAEAVLDSGRRKIVFVEQGDGNFEPREVETGWRFDGRIEVVRGLAAAERIAIAGNFLLDSESRIPQAAAAIEQDPVCGMKLDRAGSRQAAHYGGHE